MNDHILMLTVNHVKELAELTDKLVDRVIALEAKIKILENQRATDTDERSACCGALIKGEMFCAECLEACK